VVWNNFINLTNWIDISIFLTKNMLILIRLHYIHIYICAHCKGKQSKNYVHNRQSRIFKPNYFVCYITSSSFETFLWVEIEVSNYFNTINDLFWNEPSRNLISSKKVTMLLKSRLNWTCKEPNKKKTVENALKKKKRKRKVRLKRVTIS
jgi:hypothetical protein